MPIKFQAQSSQPVRGAFAVVVSQYNPMITEKICDAAVQTLLDNGVSDEDIEVVYVPGAWELSLATRILLDQKRHSGIICLGCVIKGETTHDQHINREVSRALGQLGMETRVPIAFGLLTCNNLKQAEARSGGNRGNKGTEAAQSAVDMVRLIQTLSAQ